VSDIQEEESVALEKVPGIAENVAGRQKGAKCKPEREPQVQWQLTPPPAVPESSDECAMHDASMEVTQLLFEDCCSDSKVTDEQVFEPGAMLTGEPAPMKAETWVPHLADLLAIRIPSQWMLEAT
jgi:hypothetical protein